MWLLSRITSSLVITIVVSSAWIGRDGGAALLIALGQESFLRSLTPRYDDALEYTQLIELARTRQDTEVSSLASHLLRDEDHSYRPDILELYGDSLVYQSGTREDIEKLYQIALERRDLPRLHTKIDLLSPKAASASGLTVTRELSTGSTASGTDALSGRLRTLEGYQWDRSTDLQIGVGTSLDESSRILGSLRQYSSREEIIDW